MLTKIALAGQSLTASEIFYSETSKDIFDVTVTKNELILDGHGIKYELMRVKYTLDTPDRVYIAGTLLFLYPTGCIICIC